MEDLAIDLHVLTMERTPAFYRKTCMDSLALAIARSPIPVHLHVVEGINGHVGQGRAKAYALGNAPYVTHVDDDDWIIPESFEKIAPHLASRPDAVCPSEYTYEEKWIKLTPHYRRHSLVIFKREHLIDHTPWVVSSDARQTLHLGNLNVIDIDDLLYVWRRQRLSNSRRLTRQHEHAKEFDDIPNFLAATTRKRRR